MTLKNRTVVFDAQSMRFEDWNGHLRVHNTNLTKANVCEYYGVEINNHKQYGLDPNKKYRFLRSPDALEKAVSSFKERPVLYLHKAADAEKLDNSKVIGTTGSDPRFDFPYIKDSITIWDGNYIDAIKNNTQAELSASYAFTPVMEKGEFEGQPYDGIMTEIFVDHIALVEQGRAGPDVRVADAKPQSIQLKGKEMAKLNAVGKRLMVDLATLSNNGRVHDSNGKALVDIISKSNHSSKKGMAKSIAGLMVGYSMANDEEAEKIEETVNKAMDEECKARDSDDPVDTLEAEDDDDDDKKTQASDSDDPDNKTPKVGDEGDDPDKKPSTASDSAIAFDAAAMERRITVKLQAENTKRLEALKLVRPLVGEYSTVSDSAEEILSYALQQANGELPPKGCSYEQLQYGVNQALKAKSQSSRAHDSIAVTKSDKERFGATRLGSI